MELLCVRAVRDRDQFPEIALVSAEPSIPYPRGSGAPLSSTICKQIGGPQPWCCGRDPLVGSSCPSAPLEAARVAPQEHTQLAAAPERRRQLQRREDTLVLNARLGWGCLSPHSNNLFQLISLPLLSSALQETPSAVTLSSTLSQTDFPPVCDVPAVIRFEQGWLCKPSLCALKQGDSSLAQLFPPTFSSGIPSHCLRA